ncbi:MFS transporter [Tessaracoccus sp. MC1679]|uniref:MFS transporter n=1 Tax=Tessaracoccus sp. MC1679 TaxID=2760313 RepID=UPI0015FF2F33|nr:MFS transporter [Tessaracoccus sp. MC1679]MBB1516116.1 MFS transporter [Tessaracoccus sp. MC1679]
MAVRPLDRRFRVHLSTVALANLADGVVATGVPLLAVTLTRSPALIGLLTAAVWLPWLLAGIPAGVLVDRWDRRRTMLVALTVRALLLASVAVVGAAGGLSIWWLVGFALAYGFTEVFTDLAAQAQVPALVGRDGATLRSANSRLLAVEQAAGGFVAPPVAGLLVAVGAAWVTGVPALIVVGAVVVLALGLRGRFTAPRPAVDGEGEAGAAARAGSLRRELGEGLSVLWRHRVLRPLLIAAGLWNFASTALSAVIVLWMVGPGSAGGLTPQEWSLILVAMPVGGLFGSVVAGPLTSRWPEMRVLVACWGSAGLINLLPLLWPAAWSFALFLICAGVFGVVGNVVSGSLRPRMVEERLLGRVHGAARVIGFGTMPLGAVVGGQVAQWFGIPAVFVAVVALMLVSTAIVAVRVPQPVVDRWELRPTHVGAGAPDHVAA